MNHSDRCQLLINVFKTLGYDYIDNGQRGIFRAGKSLDPDDCNQGYIFYPDTSTATSAHNYQMFRGYVHDTQDIVYLRVNTPGLPYGLGQTPLAINLAELDFAKKIDAFCHRTSVSTAVIEQLISEHCLRTRGTKKIETIKCSGFGACEGSGKRTFRAGAAGSYQDDCKVCGGKGTRRQVTERYYLSNSGED